MTDAARLFIAIYTDEDISSELAPMLRERGFEAQSALEAEMIAAEDGEQLAFASARDMAILTSNVADFVRLAHEYALAGRPHAGIIISSEQFSRRRMGDLLRMILRLLNTLSADELRNNVVYLQNFTQGRDTRL
jgi:predicted nuclease of predicted toxin-antitoxin system